MKNLEEVDTAIKRFYRQPVIMQDQIDAFINRMKHEIKDKDLLDYFLNKIISNNNRDKKTKNSLSQRKSKIKPNPNKLEQKEKRRLENIEARKRRNKKKAEQKKLQRIIQVMH